MRLVPESKVCTIPSVGIAMIQSGVSICNNRRNHTYGGSKSKCQQEYQQNDLRWTVGGGKLDQERFPTVHAGSRGRCAEIDLIHAEVALRAFSIGGSLHLYLQQRIRAIFLRRHCCCCFVFSVQYPRQLFSSPSDGQTLIYLCNVSAAIDGLLTRIVHSVSVVVDEQHNTHQEMFSRSIMVGASKLLVRVLFLSTDNR